MLLIRQQQKAGLFMEKSNGAKASGANDQVLRIYFFVEKLLAGFVRSLWWIFISQENHHEGREQSHKEMEYLR